MTALSIVVANVDADHHRAVRAVSSVVDQLAPDDQLVWVDALGSPCPWAGATSAPAPAGTTLGELYAMGLGAARHARIVFIDSTTVLGPTWRDEVERAAGSLAVVGGPVEPAWPRSPNDWAGFFVEYGPHAVAPYTSATGDVAANNVVYDRRALEAVLEPGEPVWKSEVNGRVRAAGGELVLSPRLRVTSTKRYRRRDLVQGRVVAGRRYGGQRARHWGRRRRTIAAIACGALPVVAYARLAARIGKDPTLRRPFVASTPMVLVALVCWSAGEAWGYLTGEGRARRVS